MSDRHPGFLSAETPKPKRLAMSALGQDAISHRTGRSKPLPRAVVEQGSRLAQHGACAEHVEVTGGGSSQTVCVLRGQDRDQVVAEARDLMGGR